MLFIFLWGRIRWRNCHCRKHPGFFYFLCAGLNSFLLLCPLSLLLLLWDAVTVELGSAEPPVHTDTHFWCKLLFLLWGLCCSRGRWKRVGNVIPHMLPARTGLCSACVWWWGPRGFWVTEDGTGRAVSRQVWRGLEGSSFQPCFSMSTWCFKNPWGATSRLIGAVFILSRFLVGKKRKLKIKTPESETTFAALSACSTETLQIRLRYVLPLCFAQALVRLDSALCWFEKAESKQEMGQESTTKVLFVSFIFPD